MSPTLFWATTLLAAAIAVIVIEMFVPSGGILGLLATSLAIAAIVLMFWQEGFVRGTLFMLATFVVLPIVVMVAIRHWPYTAMGRRILNLPPGSQAHATSEPRLERLKQLVGEHGVATSKMLPSGTIKIGSEFYDAVCQSGAVDSGRSVKVVSVDGTRILVRELGDDEAVASVDLLVPDPFEI